MKINIIKFFLFMTLPVVSSCAHYGGGTIGTGLPLAGTTTSSVQTGVVYFGLSGVLITKNNRPVRFARVNIKTSKIEESVMTDESGNFNVELIADSKERALISVEVNNELYNGNVSIPDGLSESMTATVVLDTKSKSITISDLQYY